MVKATRNFIAHLEGQHRTFVKGETIPEEWLGSVGTRSLVDEDLDHLPTEAELAEQRPAATGNTGPKWSEQMVASYDTEAAAANIDGLIEWVLDDSGPGDKHHRAQYARVREGDGKRRATAISRLGEILRDNAPTIEVSTDPETDDPSAT